MKYRAGQKLKWTRTGSVWEIIKNQPENNEVIFINSKGEEDNCSINFLDKQFETNDIEFITK